MYPKHTRNVKETAYIRGKTIKNRAVAPYNFVELPEFVVEAELENGKLRSQDRYHLDRKTGKIDCELKTSSPLYIRCGLTKKEFASGEESKNLPNFFYTDLVQKVPVLPGSSLRGMLRSLVEIAGYGKFDRVSDQSLMYRAVGDTTSIGDEYRDRLSNEIGYREYESRVQAGYIKDAGNGNWEIVPAQKVSDDQSFARIEKSEIPKNLQSYKNIQNAFYSFVQKVRPTQANDHNKDEDGKPRVKLHYAKVTSISSKAVDDKKANSVIVTTGHMNAKHMEYVFGLPDETASAWAISDEMASNYREQITKDQKALLGDKAVLQDNHPVFYLIEDGKLVFFGHTMMFRLPFKNSVKAFVPEYLKDQDTIDLAEAMFGFVRQDKDHDGQQAVAGRVFISDGKCAQPKENIWLMGDATKSLTPKILSSPKSTTFQHYLVQDDTAKADKDTLKHYESRPLDETVLRGHKLYWHKGSSPEIQNTSKKKILAGKVVSDTQTTQIKPIKPGVEFTFSIHFENLTTIELGALLWVLKIAQDDRYRLSLGMGKPLGMGAVKIAHRTFLNTRKVRYERLFSVDADSWETGYSVLEAEESYIQTFESYVLGDHSDKQSFDEDRRIRMLLTMLLWDNAPPAEKTRYMEIERDVRQYPNDYIGRKKGNKANEYGERPVLPTPLQVIGQEEAIRYDSSNIATQRPTKQKSEKQNKRQESIESLVENLNLKEGDVVEAVVIKKGKKVTYALGGVMFNEKEPKKYDEIPTKGRVKVRVTVITEGIVKHIKFAGRL